MTKTKQTRFLGCQCRAMKPTLNHRPAIWECMLGTVYAMRENDDGTYETHYFDYDYDAAFEFADVTQDRDPRLYRNKRRVRWADDSTDNPGYNRLVLWILGNDECRQSGIRPIIE